MANRRLLLIVFLVFILIPIKGSDTRITFIDVGQGDGIYIYAGEDILIDGGSSSTKKIGKYTLEPFLKSQRIGSIEKLFVTHADSDHINGLIYLAQSSNIDIKELYLPSCAAGDENYDELLDAFDISTPKENSGGMHTLISYIEAGDVIPLKRGSITCMSPSKGSRPSDMNDQSLILLYREGTFSALFNGDAGKETELLMLDAVSKGELPDIKAITLLKAGHHGSRTSTSEELISTVSPLICVLSYGEGNRYGHPHDETLQLLDKYHVRTLHTAASGAITVTTNGRTTVKISRFLD